MLDVFGANQTIGHDIGCQFSTTLRNCSFGDEANEKGLRIIVNAFHGHAHDHLCQLLFHTMYQLGLGIEDLESCE